MSGARLAVALRHELRLLVRYRILHAAVFVAVSLIGVAGALPRAAVPVALPVLLFTEAATIGLFLIAGLEHYERDEGTGRALAVSPLTHGERLSVRVGSLSVLAILVAGVVSAAAAVLPGRLERLPSLPLVAVAVGLMAPVVLLVGGLVAARVSSISSYVIAVQLPLTPLALPLLPYFGVAETPLWWLLPSHGALVLLEAAVAGRLSAPSALASVAVMSAWISGLTLVADRRHRAGRGVS